MERNGCSWDSVALEGTDPEHGIGNKEGGSGKAASEKRKEAS